MSILVIGTSNTLVRGGWYDGFRDAIDEETRRIALGGAPFTQFLASLKKAREMAPDHVIVECSPNDEAYAAHVGSELFFDRLYYMLLSSLRSFAGVTILRIPPENHLGGLSPVALRQQFISRDLGCSYHDAAPDILELAGQPGAAYRDKYHPTTEIANALGRRMAERLAGRAPDRPGECVNFEACFEEIRLQMPDARMTRIETSLLEEDFLVIEPNRNVSLGETRYVLGFFVDAGETAGVARLQSANDKRDIFCFYTDRSNRNIKRFVPLKNGMHMRSLACVHPHRAIDVSLQTDIFYIRQKLAVGGLICFDSRKVNELPPGA